MVAGIQQPRSAMIVIASVSDFEPHSDLCGRTRQDTGHEQV